MNARTYQLSKGREIETGSTVSGVFVLHSEYAKLVNRAYRLMQRNSALEAFVAQVATDTHDCISPGYMRMARDLLESSPASGETK
jgi:hypothetical protein